MRPFVFKAILSSLLNVAIFALLLLPPAGTLRWWRAWFFLGVVFIAALVSMFSVFPGNEALLQERFKPPIQQGQPLADRIVIVLFLLTFMGVVVFIPVDVFRLHRLLGSPGPFVSLLGLVLFLAGWCVLALAMKQNAYAAPVVKHQSERGQTVVDTGVYAIVRHPMYAGGALLLVGMPLWLGSYAAAVAAVVPTATLAVRILVEERFLKRELEGYEEYTKRIRYRLIPFIW